MELFTIQNCNPEYVIGLKNQYKKFANKQEVRDAFTKLLNETHIAIRNIEELLHDSEHLQKLLLSLRQCDTAILDSVLGTCEQGQNNSHYRAYLALDEKSVIETRIANHYETKNAILDKSNNKSQYLYQIILITTPPMEQSKDAITNNTNVGNVKILTKGYISSNTAINDVEELLKSVHDHLIHPNNEFDDAIYNRQ